MLYVMEASVKNPGQPRITLRMVFEHMLNMDQRLTQRMDAIEQIMQGMLGVQQGLRADINRVERKVDLALVQIGNIDARLDHLEVVEIPRLKKARGMA
jgi:hypothetical protein